MRNKMFNLQNLPKHVAPSVLRELSESEKRANAASHRIGNVDGVYRCVWCEIGVWNSWKEAC